MTVQSSRRSGGGYLERPAPSGLADVIDIILDKGLVIDAYVRVSLVGIEILTIDARIVIASVDTYLRFAEATNRLDLESKAKDLEEMVEGMTNSGASGKTSGMLEGAKDAIFGSGDDDDDDDDESSRSSSRRRSSSGSSSSSRSRRTSSSRSRQES